MTCVLRLAALPSRVPGLRQRIPRITTGLCFLGHPAPVGPCGRPLLRVSAGCPCQGRPAAVSRGPTRLSRSCCSCGVETGLSYPPGFVGVTTRRFGRRWPLACPFLGEPVSLFGSVRHNDGSTDIRLRYPYPPAPGGVPETGTTSPVSSPRNGLMVSRYRWGGAFRWSPQRRGIAPRVEQQVV